MCAHTRSCLTGKLQYFKFCMFTFHTGNGQYVILLEWTDMERFFQGGYLAKYSKNTFMHFLICNKYLQVVKNTDNLVTVNSLS
jgi:hypothetical protein